MTTRRGRSTSDTAAAYFENWQRGDFDGLTDVLADDVDFVGSMGSAQGVTDCIRGMRGVRSMVDEIHVVKRWVDGADAITWFELRRAGHDPIPTVNWSHVVNGSVDRIRVTFDPRPLLA